MRIDARFHQTFVQVRVNRLNFLWSGRPLVSKRRAVVRREVNQYRHHPSIDEEIDTPAGFFQRLEANYKMRQHCSCRKDLGRISERLELARLMFFKVLP